MDQGSMFCTFPCGPMFLIVRLLSIYQGNNTQVMRSFFICEKFPSLLSLLVFIPDILRSCKRKFAFCFRARAKPSEKGNSNCHKSQTFVCAGLENSSKNKNAHNFCHKN